jgi:hypothetical protein
LKRGKRRLLLRDEQADRQRAADPSYTRTSPDRLEDAPTDAGLSPPPSRSALVMPASVSTLFLDDDDDEILRQ